MHEQHRQLSSEIDTLLESLQNLDPKEKDKKHSDIEMMIKYYVGLTQAIEDRRNRMCDFAIQYLVVLVAVGGVLTGQRENIPFWLYVMLMTALVVQGAFSLHLIYRYEQQSIFRYPFLDYGSYGNQWKWFYRGNPVLSRVDQQSLVACRDPEQAKTMYLEGLREFAERYLHETQDCDLASDIKQLYLMQVHNLYKNQFYLELAELRHRSVKWTVLLSLLTALIIWIAGQSNYEHERTREVIKDRVHYSQEFQEYVPEESSPNTSARAATTK